MINITSSQEITKIYLVTNCYGDPNKVYIGKTKNIRYRDHKNNFGNQIIYNEIDQIHSLYRKDWEPLESYWIEQFRQWGFDVQNKNKGGGGPIGYSEATRLKMINSIKGKPKPKDFGLKISIILKERKLTESHKKNIGLFHKNRIRTPEENIKRGIACRKPIIQYDLNGNYIKLWDGIEEVSKILGIRSQGITNNLKNRSKSAGGFIWKYL